MAEPTIKLATWNVNSIRARIDRLMSWLERNQPDVMCLQELKVADDEFPVDELWSAGYDAAFHGQRTYNGVAILSRTPLTDVRVGLDGGPEADQARLIAATVAGLRVISVYVPNGQTVGSDKWDYKLRWLDRLAGHLGADHSPSAPLVLAGDFNVAPEDRDVAHPDKWRNSVLFHEEARKAFERLLAWGLVDAIRLHHQGPGPYSWWDYRMLSFPKGDGLRIDHVLLTEPLAARCVGASIDRNERKGKLPSDHAPVMVELTR
jgi:exodeoxyribonuclease-3